LIKCARVPRQTLGRQRRPRLRGYLVDQVKASAGNPDALQQAVADLLFLIHDHPVAGAYWYWDALEGCPGQPAQPSQFDVMIAMTRETQGEQQAELAAHWLGRQPEAFRVFEGPDGEIGGYAARLALHLASPEDIEADPGTAALWRYSQQHHPPRPGELVLGWRFVVDRDPDERHPRLAGTMFGAWHVIDILLRGPTAWNSTPATPTWITGSGYSTTLTSSIYLKPTITLAPAGMSPSATIGGESVSPTGWK
jgi:hypothetical protein